MQKSVISKKKSPDRLFFYRFAAAGWRQRGSGALGNEGQRGLAAAGPAAWAFEVCSSRDLQRRGLASITRATHRVANFFNVKELSAALRTAFCFSLLWSNKPAISSMLMVLQLLTAKVAQNSPQGKIFGNVRLPIGSGRLRGVDVTNRLPRILDWLRSVLFPQFYVAGLLCASRRIFYISH